MALIELSLMAAWTLVVVRLFAARATFSDRTLLTHVALGALMALTAAPLAEKFIVPYPLDQYDFPFVGEFLRVIVRNLVLLTPVIACLFIRRTHRLVSIADAFLLAFVIGFGFELVGAFLASSQPRAAMRGFTLMPPWQFTWDPEQRFPILGTSGDFALAGVAYAIGSVCLVLAAMMRFGRGIAAAVVTAVVALLVVSAFEALWVRQIVSSGTRLPGAGFFWGFDWVMLHGKLLATGSLLALIYLSGRETRWVAKLHGTPPPPRLQVLDEWHQRLNALLREGVSAYGRASERARLVAQAAFARAERVKSPDSPDLSESAQLLELKLQQAQAEASVVTGAPPVKSLAARAATGLSLVALLLAVVVMPWVPGGVAQPLWKFALLNFPLPLVSLTVLHVLLMALVLWWFVLRPGPPREDWNPDVSVRSAGEGGLSLAALGAALLVAFQVPLDSFYPPFSSLPFLNRASHPRFDAPQLAAVLLLAATLASGLMRGPALKWHAAATPRERRLAIVRNSLLAVNSAIFVWLAVKVYVPLLASLQKALGPGLYPIFGRLGNLATAVLATLLLFAAGVVVGMLLGKVSQFVERLLVTPEKEP